MPRVGRVNESFRRVTASFHRAELSLAQPSGREAGRGSSGRVDKTGN